MAFCGVVPVRMSVGNKPIMAAQSCDIMVHPEHRKKGLFAVLSERIFALAKEKGIHFIFGFPNNNSYEGFVNRLGFTHLETMHRYTFSFNDSLFKKLSRKLLGFSMENNNQIIQNEFLNQGFDGVIYDKGYNSYKKYNKNKIIEHNGNYYWISRAGDLFVGAIQLKNPDQLTESLQFIEKTEKAVSATFMLSPGTQLGDALSKFYKAEEGFPIIVKNISGKYSLDNLKFQFSNQLNNPGVYII